jgi:hypothetical protein
MSIPWALSPYLSKSTKGSPPLTEFPQREMFPSGALQLSVRFLVKWTPQVPIGPLKREVSVNKSCFYTFPSKSPVHDPPSMVPNRISMEREISSPETMVY